MKEWTFTFSNELPLWELESRWTLKSSKRNCKGQNPLDWGVPYIIGNLLECRCLKWACITYLNTSNTSYGQKRGRESNWQFDSQLLKVENRPDFLWCRWCATYCLKAPDEGYNFALDFISIGGMHTKLWAPKVVVVPTMEISKLPFGSLGTKWHLGASPMAKHKLYYKGEGDVLPQVRAMVSFVSLCLLVARPCTKVLQLRTNQFVVWFVQVCVSDWIACQSS